jgi:hypothetical protein
MVNVINKSSQLCRYAQSLTMGAYTHSQDPSNDYVLTTSKTGWTKLAQGPML